MIHGLLFLALINNDLIALSLSPTYLFNNSGPLIEIKLAFASLATAFANNVFPHPGGPYKRTPTAFDIPTIFNLEGSVIGKTIS